MSSVSIDLWGGMDALTNWLMDDVLGAFFNWLGLHGFADFLMSDTLGTVIMLLLFGIFVFVVGFLGDITMIWQERKMLGRLMDRRGTMVGPLGYFQNIADGLKTFLKETIIPENADEGVFNLVPVLYIGTSVLLLGTLPLSTQWYMSNSELGVLLTFAIFCIAPFVILLGGWASNNKYTLIGGMRAAAQIISYEIPLFLAVVSVIILTGSMNYGDIVAWQQANMWLGIPLIIGFIVFFIGITAEAERVPFDLPEAEAELVEGWGTEYGGFRFGLMMLTDYFRGYAGCAVVALLFLGGWDGPFPSIIPEEVWFLLKAFIVFAVMIWVRGALPRVRTDQILSIGWKRLLPLAAINVFIAIALKATGVF